MILTTLLRKDLFDVTAFKHSGYPTTEQRQKETAQQDDKQGVARVRVAVSRGRGNGRALTVDKKKKQEHQDGAHV